MAKTSKATTTAARGGDQGPPPLLAAFLDELSAQLTESVGEVTGEVENGMHQVQKLVSNGNKHQQARQLNIVAKSSSAYMQKVQSAFEKNFDKFEIYVRRNIVAVPANVADEVAQMQAKQHQQQWRASQTEDDLDDPSLSKEEQLERRTNSQLKALRRKIRELTEANQQLELEQKALDARAQTFRGLVAKMEFLEDVPQQTVAPLKRAVEHVSTLRESFQHMDAIQEQIEDDTRQFKKAKLATRSTFRNLRKRFMARTAAMDFQSTDDLKELHAKLRLL